jgi:hypothetical protein
VSNVRLRGVRDTSFSFEDRDDQWHLELGDGPRIRRVEIRAVSPERWTVRRSILFVCVLLLASACVSDPELGSCDFDQARQLVFQAPNGVTEIGNTVVPMYAGQALLTQRCNEGECEGHAYYDLSPACPIGCCNDGDCLRTARRVCGDDDACVEEFVVRGHEQRASGSERLQANQWKVFDRRRAIWGAASRRSLGRRGPASGAALFTDVEDFQLVEEVPGLDTESGREALRNWLACGSPVVELVNPGFGDRVARCGDGSVGECVRLPFVPTAPEPTWSSIFDVVIEPLCGQCHSEGCTDGCADLSLETRMGAYERLRDGRGEAVCGDRMGERFLTPGDPDDSGFYTALTVRCWYHDGLYLPDEVLAPIRAWIEAGASP